jgi:hypothetical protein
VRAALVVLGILIVTAAQQAAMALPQRVPAQARAQRGAGDARPHSFHFTRAIYQGGGWRGGAWATDYPKADQQLVSVLARLVDRLDVSPHDHAIRLDDPELRRHPFLYAVEVGQMMLSDAEVAGLRAYLLAGGFLMVDDFWGTREWAQFESQIRRVLPEYPIVELALDHPLLSTFYDVEEIVQVPSINNWRYRRQTHERDGHVPALRAIFDDAGRLLVVIHFNSDLGDAWEWAEQPDYPLEFSTYAMQMTANNIIFALSH